MHKNQALITELHPSASPLTFTAPHSPARSHLLHSGGNKLSTSADSPKCALPHPSLPTFLLSSFFAFPVGGMEGSASQGRVRPSADTHRKDCPEAKTRSSRSSERGHGTEAQRPGLEIRVRCLMLPSRQEPNSIRIAASRTSRPGYSEPDLPEP